MDREGRERDFFSQWLELQRNFLSQWADSFGRMQLPWTDSLGFSQGVTTPYAGLFSQWSKMIQETIGKTAGQAEEGLTVFAEALAITDRTGERYYEADLHRLRGELTLQSASQSGKSRATEAETHFAKALEVAHHQRAKSWELRAAMSLARLWQQQGKTAEAHELLAPVYNWFTEGFDTADLKDAKALLVALS